MATSLNSTRTARLGLEPAWTAPLKHEANVPPQNNTKMPRYWSLTSLTTLKDIAEISTFDYDYYDLLPNTLLRHIFFETAFCFVIII